MVPAVYGKNWQSFQRKFASWALVSLYKVKYRSIPAGGGVIAALCRDVSVFRLLFFGYYAIFNHF